MPKCELKSLQVAVNIAEGETHFGGKPCPGEIRMSKIKAMASSPTIAPAG